MKSDAHRHLTRGTYVRTPKAGRARSEGISLGS